jgi:hypothetical protein
MACWWWWLTARSGRLVGSGSWASPPVRLLLRPADEQHALDAAGGQEPGQVPVHHVVLALALHEVHPRATTSHTVHGNVMQGSGQAGRLKLPTTATMRFTPRPGTVTRRPELAAQLNHRHMTRRAGAKPR